MTPRATNPRRSFLGHLAAAAAAVSLPVGRLHAAPAAQQNDHDAWIDRVQGDHRCLFDFPKHSNGFPLLHILNYLGTYQSAYGTGAGRVGAVGTFYGMGGGSSIAMGFDDAMWEKYELGAYLGLSDANGRAYTRNVFYQPTDADGHLFAQALQSPPLPMFGGAIVGSGIEALQGMGTTFLMCNNALNGWAFELEARGKGAQADLNTDLRAHLLPGVIIVPAMVIAIEKAQEAGIRYNKQ
jgi:hypothetical protein